MRAFLGLCAAILLFADGGTVVLHKQAGPFDVTVFSKSDVVQAGPSEFSVLVQRQNSTVMDASVLLHLEQTHSSGEITRLTGIASHAKAKNKTLYAVTMNVPSTGAWAMQADVTSAGQSGAISGRINVLPPQAPVQNYWPYIAMVPALALAFIINRKLRRKYRPHSR